MVERYCRATGGGWVNGNYADNFFLSANLKISAIKVPYAGSAVIYQDVLTKESTLTLGTIVDEELGPALQGYIGDTAYNLTPTSVSGTVLASYFTTGVTVTGLVLQSGEVNDSNYFEFDSPAMPAGTGLTATAIGAYPGLDLANKQWKMSSYTPVAADAVHTGNAVDLSFTFDDDYILTGGTMKLRHLNASGAVTSTETMQFTLAAP